MSDARRLESRTAYAGKILDLGVDRVELPNGRVVDLEVVRHPGAAAMVPLEESGEVVLVRQYRYAADGWLLEVPAGKRDAGETPQECAARELEEEVGCRASRWTELGSIWTTPGFTDERIWLYLARDLEPTRQALDSDEILSVERVPLETAVQWAKDGRISDGKSVAALLRAAAFLEKT